MSVCPFSFAWGHKYCISLICLSCSHPLSYCCSISHQKKKNKKTKTRRFQLFALKVLFTLVSKGCRKSKNTSFKLAASRELLCSPMEGGAENVKKNLQTCGTKERELLSSPSGVSGKQPVPTSLIIWYPKEKKKKRKERAGHFQLFTLKANSSHC
ncbi:hypothetical protein CMV_010786 [Castanea mollissima]|uniref:Uncharacterized protein n=1 Tax=Castanea mollissima TaxID=60419 RepID=A0A8J4RIN7_9ROSI|nr:hypothetical protein CMV_010786 [Castanea mollissima]